MLGTLMGTASSTEKNAVCSGAHNPTSLDAANNDVGFSHSLFSFCHPPRLGAWALEPHNVRNRTVGYPSLPTQVKRDGYAEPPNDHLSSPESKRKPNGNVRRYGMAHIGHEVVGWLSPQRRRRATSNPEKHVDDNFEWAAHALTRCFPARRKNKNKNIACSTPPSIAPY